MKPKFEKGDLVRLRVCDVYSESDREKVGLGFVGYNHRAGWVDVRWISPHRPWRDVSGEQPEHLEKVENPDV